MANVLNVERKKMKEINPFLIDENTPPSYETDDAKWYLIKNLEYYAGWRWESKKDYRKAFLITDKKTNSIIGESFQLENLLYKMDVFEKVKENDERQQVRSEED